MAKMRSPNYPAAGLSESLERVRRLWSKEKRTPVDAGVAAEAIGYSGVSGPSRTALASMKKYGLVEADGKTVRVSGLALRILHPANEYEQLSALQEAALNPDLFRQLFETLKDASDGALKSHLITKLGFSEVGAKQLVKAYRETITISKLDQPLDHTPPIGNEERIDELADTAGLEFIPVTETSAQLSARSSNAKDKNHRYASQAFSWPLALGVVGEVKILGGEAKPQYFRALRNYLEMAEKLLEDQESNTGRPPVTES